MTSPDAEKETSVEDDIREAFANLAGNEPKDESFMADEPEAGVEPAEIAADDKGTQRDENGRFKSKEPKDETQVADAPADPVEPQPDDAEVKPDPFGLAPQNVKAALKAKWAELPPEARQAIVERESEIHREFTRQDGDFAFGKRVKNVVAPYEDFIKGLGADPVQAFDYLLKTDYALRTAPAEQRREMFLKAARDYGVDLGGSFAQQPAEMQVNADPRLETLQERIDRLERERNADMMLRRDEEQQQINSQIESFASKPENVYFEQVKPLMASLLQNGQAGSLEEAYEKAVWANPETRALHLAAQRATEDRKRQQAEAEAAKAARKASPSVTGAPGSAVPAYLNGSASGSVEDDIRAAMQAVSGRA